MLEFPARFSFLLLQLYELWFPYFWQIYILNFIHCYVASSHSCTDSEIHSPCYAVIWNTDFRGRAHNEKKIEQHFTVWDLNSPVLLSGWIIAQYSGLPVMDPACLSRAKDCGAQISDLSLGNPGLSVHCCLEIVGLLSQLEQSPAESSWEISPAAVYLGVTALPSTVWMHSSGVF